MPLSRIYLFFLLTLFGTGSFAGCQKIPHDDPSAHEHSFALADTPRDGEFPTPEEIDAKIKGREERQLLTIQNHPYHKNKTLTQQMALAQVGKKTIQEFFLAVRNSATLGQSSKEEKQIQNTFLEYKRIWYLADEAYKATRSRKFRPEIALIPYLLRGTPQESLSALLYVFKEELAQESKDPRALGAECSEMLKLQAIVDNLSIRADF